MSEKLQIDQSKTKLVSKETQPPPNQSQSLPEKTKVPTNDNAFISFFKQTNEKVRGAFGSITGKSKASNQPTEEAQTEYTTTEINHIDEAERQEEIKKDNDEFFKSLFKSREIDFKKDPFDMRNDRLNADLLKDAFEIKFKDSDGRIILHRAALEQRPDTLRQTFQNLEHLSKQGLANIIEQKDNYGNTPLILTCIYDIEQKRDNRFDVVKQLLLKGANPNIQNPRSLFTPLHWAALNGAKDIVNILLEFDAKEYIPDQFGLYPIDYAGYFRHIDTVITLIQHTLRKIDQMKRQHQNELSWETFLSIYYDRNGRQGTQYSTYVNPILQFNPQFHTSILYWASMFDEIDNSLLDQILKKLEAYPEGPVIIDNWKTPCHAAAYQGNAQKLKLLMNNIHTRYQKVVVGSPQRQAQQSQTQICPYFHNRWISLLKQNRYSAIKKFYYEVFEAKLNSYKTMPKFKYDFQDRFLNTPLHIASQHGNAICAQMLINEYQLSLDKRNQQGWMPKDLNQHDAIKALYQQFYKNLDKQFNAENKSKSFTDEENKSASTTKGASGVNLANQVTINQIIENSSGQERILTEKQMVNKELIRCREWMPQIAPLVLKVNIRESQVINRMIMLLQNQGFSIQMFPSLDQNYYYIALKLNQQKLENEAKLIKLQVKLCDIDAKQPFEPNQKVKFEPFRSKDVQLLMVTLIQKIINTQQLIQQNIMIQILPMHDFYEIHEIRTKFEQRSRFFMQPIPLLTEMYKESSRFEFTDLSAIKNYFGEKTGFYFAWMSFYTSWLIIPATLSLALTIYQNAYDVDTIFTALYSLLICIWVTIFIERWKRKCSELALRWGILVNKNDQTRQIRPEFNGDEYFSRITNQVDKSHVSQKHYFFTILSIPIFFILIGSCIGVYFGTKAFKDNNLNGDKNHDTIIQTLAGIINGISIAIVNFIYQKLALLSMKLENHKYTDSYEHSFVLKLFAFKFINTNISLFYTAFIDQKFESLYYLLLGMVIQKSIQILALKQFNFLIIHRCGMKLLKFWWARRSYFKRVAALAREQQLQHQNFLNELDLRTKTEFEMKINEIRQKPIFSKFGNDPVKSPIYQRLVFNTSKGIDDQQFLIDYVEINSLMVVRLEQDEINENSEVFILFGLATLYACACPIVTIIVMIHNIFDIRLDLLAQYTSVRRVLPQSRINVGPWQQIMDFMGISAVISNCCLLYFSSPTLRTWIANSFEVYSETYLLWIIIGVEHFIIIVKVFCSAAIPDIPTWVKKTLQKVKNEQEKLMIEENERDENDKIAQLKSKLDEFESRNKNMLATMKVKIKKMKADMQQKDLKLRDLGVKIEQKKEEKEIKSAKVIKEIQTVESKEKKPEELRLVDFIGISKNEFFAEERRDLLEKSLTRNLKNRLFSQTFNTFEKEILSRRIARLYETKKINQINCAQCSSSVATIECPDCQDHFCKNCSDVIHSQDKYLFSMHPLIPLPLEPLQKFQLIKAQSEKQTIPISLSSAPQWKKFEYFNFPIEAGNDLHIYIQKQYVFLRQHYIDFNYIEPQDQIFYQGLFIDKQYDLLTDVQAEILRRKEKKAFGDKIQESQSERFNDEELYYMNRIAYYLFRHKGENLTFANFLTRLNILQNSGFQKRSTLWLAVLDEKGDEIISRQVFERAIRVAFVQDITMQIRDVDVIDMIFSSQPDPSKPAQLHESLTINKILEVLNKNETVKNFMNCILQYDPKQIIEE